MDKIELIMRRRSVYAFIDADPIDLVVSRNLPPVKNELTGGYAPNPASPLVLDSQVARIVQNVRRYTDGIVNAEAGDIPDTEYRLIGRHDIDLQVDDEFVWLGEHYRVTGIHVARTESTLAAIDLAGKKNRNG